MEVFGQKGEMNFEYGLRKMTAAILCKSCGWNSGKGSSGFGRRQEVGVGMERESQTGKRHRRQS